jgi:hypothetical protein
MVAPGGRLARGCGIAHVMASDPEPVATLGIPRAVNETASQPTVDCG